MDNFSIGIFTIPTIVLSLVVLLYFYFKSKVKNKKPYRRMVISIAATAFMLNLIWEVVQGPLYDGFEYDLKHVSFCALASIADMLMVLILLFGFGLIYRNVFWMNFLSPKRIIILVMVGTVGAIIAEMWHTTQGDWTYVEAMPIVPGVGVGLSPVLQFAVLPYLIFLIGKKFIKEGDLEM
jgi:cation transport ATPase